MTKTNQTLKNIYLLKKSITASGGKMEINILYKFNAILPPIKFK
jgi:hypothetical protein